jgi:hypothetical protein
MNMSLLKGLSKPEKVWPCRVRTLSAEFDKEDKQIFDEAVGDVSWAAETLSKALAAKGVTIAGSAITRHRKKECSCLKI